MPNEVQEVLPNLGKPVRDVARSDAATDSRGRKITAYRTNRLALAAGRGLPRNARGGTDAVAAKDRSGHGRMPPTR
jgi:hypothetical protein